ncbi:MAG: helix-turn-helix transcriptional regulator [Eubacterium sp.]
MQNRIKEFRKKRKLTQQELADKVDVSTRTIISLEKEQYNPSIMLAYKIAKEFGTTIEDLYCLEVNLKNEMENL